MKKEVTLTEHDYESVLKILVNSIKLLDIHVDELRKNNISYPVDSLHEYEQQIFTGFIHLDKYIRADLYRELKEEYFNNFPDSVLNYLSSEY